MSEKKTMKNKKIVVLQGGHSEEREVSLTSSAQIGTALEEAGYDVRHIDPIDFETLISCIDDVKRHQPLIVFNGLHGGYGEDGTIQTIMDCASLKYTGSGSKASMLAMDKHIAKLIAKSLKIPYPKHILLEQETDMQTEELIAEIGLPMVIKPNNSGSSVGVTIVKDESQIEEAIKSAFEYDNVIMCEKYIEGKELTVSILGKKALPIVEIRPKNGWYDYTNKYSHGKTEYIVPAPLDERRAIVIQDYALLIYHQLGCQAYVRVDFRYDGNKFYFLELNTLPGMTPLSLTPMAAKEAGFSFIEMLEEIIACSVQ
jgi:D-alanine-D-alanine ligase